MKILLATPIYPPEIGGPSQYVKNLSEGFKQRGIKTEIVSYNNLKKVPQPFRFFFYFLNILKKTKDSEIIYAFNLVSCGAPASFCSKIFKKKFLIRLGGDFLWERAIERGSTKKPLREYYDEAKSVKEQFWIWVINKILNSSDKTIFTSVFQKQIYQRHFGVKEKNIAVVSNPFPRIEGADHQSPGARHQILYAGRLLKLKNLNILIKTFKEILTRRDRNLELKIIGEGPEKKNLELTIKRLALENRVTIEKSISHAELLKEIQKSYFCVLPSLSEVSPNFALECIKLKKPILLTRETGIFDDFKSYLIFIDPQDKNDIKEKIIYLLDEKNYQSYLGRIENISTSYSWNDVIEKHILLFKGLASFEQ